MMDIKQLAKEICASHEREAAKKLNDWYKSICKRMNARGVTQADIAKAFGIHQQNLGTGLKSRQVLQLARCEAFLQMKESANDTLRTHTL